MTEHGRCAVERLSYVVAAIRGLLSSLKLVAELAKGLLIVVFLRLVLGLKGARFYLFQRHLICCGSRPGSIGRVSLYGEACGRLAGSALVGKVTLHTRPAQVRLRLECLRLLYLVGVVLRRGVLLERLGGALTRLRVHFGRLPQLR